MKQMNEHAQEGLN